MEPDGKSSAGSAAEDPASAAVVEVAEDTTQPAESVDESATDDEDDESDEHDNEDTEPLSVAELEQEIAKLRRQSARRRIERKWLYLAVAFVLCAVSNLAIEFASGFVIPLDVAGTPPPDPRNASLRFLITAAVQAPVALGLSCYLALLGFRPR